MDIFDFVSDAIHHLLGGTSSKDLADLGADPKQVLLSGQTAGTDVFPDMGGSAVMAQVNQAVSTASQSYREGMEIAASAPHMLSAGQQAQQLIDGVMQASPEQLAKMGQQLEGMTVAAGIHNSVNEAGQHLAESNAHHAALRDADQEIIHAKAVAAAAARALDRARYV